MKNIKQIKGIIFIKALYIFSLILFCNQNIHSQNNTIGITNFKEYKCFSRNEKLEVCECIEITPIENKNIKIIQYYTKPISTYDSLNYCFSSKLIIYNKIINLDSIYYNTIKNKDLVYKAGFLEGCYIKSKRSIKLYLYFLNMSINTSQSTSVTSYK